LSGEHRTRIACLATTWRPVERHFTPGRRTTIGGGVRTRKLSEGRSSPCSRLTTARPALRAKSTRARWRVEDTAVWGRRWPEPLAHRSTAYARERVLIELDAETWSLRHGQETFLGRSSTPVSAPERNLSAPDFSIVTLEASLPGRRKRCGSRSPRSYAAADSHRLCQHADPAAFADATSTANILSASCSAPMSLVRGGLTCWRAARGHPRCSLSPSRWRGAWTRAQRAHRRSLPM
jgi:hypothetical protein